MGGYVQGHSTTEEIEVCPFCGEPISKFKPNGACVCDECGRMFYVIDDDDE